MQDNCGVCEIVAMHHSAPCLKWCLRVADLNSDDGEPASMRPLRGLAQGRHLVLCMSDPFGSHRSGVPATPPSPDAGSSSGVDAVSASPRWVEDFYRYLQLGQPYRWAPQTFPDSYEIDFRERDSWASQEALLRFRLISEYCRDEGLLNDSWRILLDEEDDFAFFDIHRSETPEVSFLYHNGVAIRSQWPYETLQCFYTTSYRENEAGAIHLRQKRKIARIFQVFLQPRLLVRPTRTAQFDMAQRVAVYWYFCLLEVRDLTKVFAPLSRQLCAVVAGQKTDERSGVGRDPRGED